MEFNTEAGRANERATAEVLSRALRADVRTFGGKFDPIDFYVVKDGRTSALIELKTRNIRSTDYADVYLAMRKWMELLRWSEAMQVAPYFAVKFLDGLCFVDARKIDASRHTFSGNSRNAAINDQEPMLLVPVAKMQRVVA